MVGAVGRHGRSASLPQSAATKLALRLTPAHRGKSGTDARSDNRIIALLWRVPMNTDLVIVGYMFAIGAGVSFVFQQAVNASLRAEIGSVWWAGVISYLGGTIVMLIAALILKEP